MTTRLTSPPYGKTMIETVVTFTAEEVAGIIRKHISEQWDQSIPTMDVAFQIDVLKGLTSAKATFLLEEHTEQ